MVSFRKRKAFTVSSLQKRGGYDLFDITNA